jgi:hypothetical protein
MDESKETLLASFIADLPSLEEVTTVRGKIPQEMRKVILHDLSGKETERLPQVC